VLKWNKTSMYGLLYHVVESLQWNIFYHIINIVINCLGEQRCHKERYNLEHYIYLIFVTQKL
jgi:hypothetical protein